MIIIEDCPKYSISLLEEITLDTIRTAVIPQIPSKKYKTYDFPNCKLNKLTSPFTKDRTIHTIAVIPNTKPQFTFLNL